MESNNRIRKQTFEFKQTNEKPNQNFEIAVGKELGWDCRQPESVPIYETENGRPEEKRQWAGSRLRREDQEAEAEYWSSRQEGVHQAETDRPVQPVEKAAEIAQGEARADGDQCAAVH